MREMKTEDGRGKKEEGRKNGRAERQGNSRTDLGGCDLLLCLIGAFMCTAPLTTAKRPGFAPMFLGFSFQFMSLAALDGMRLCTSMT